MRGSCTSRPIKTLTRPPRTPWEEAPARSPNPRKCGNEESYDKVQGSAGEGVHGICRMPGVSQEDTMERPLRRKILGGSLSLHDTAELVGGMCHCYESLELLIGISHKHWNHGKINGGQKRHYPFRHPKWRYPYLEGLRTRFFHSLPLLFFSSRPSNSNLANR